MTSSGKGLAPFVGLQPFRREDIAKFHGRGGEIGELTERWQNNRLTILHGSAGAGKTSLVAAGVLPRLDLSRFDVLPVGGVRRPPFVPVAIDPEEGDPHALALLASWSPYENPLRFAGLTISSYLRWHHWSPDGRPIMAVLDQADEVFTAFRRPPRDHPHLLDQLSDALASDDLPLRLLVVVGDEQLESLRRHDGLRAHMDEDTFFRLLPMSPDAALEACCRPLEAMGHVFEPGAGETFVDRLRGAGADLSATVEPLHLQLACTALWDSVRDRSAPIGTDDLIDVDDVLGSFTHRVINEVARDHLRGDADKLIALLRPIARQDDTCEELPQRVAQSLTERHVLHAGEKCRYEMPGRLVEPFLRRAAGVPAPMVADRLAEAAFALHRGWFDVAERYAREEIGQRPGNRSRARAESLLGDLAYLRDDVDTALEHYRLAARHYDATPGSDQIVATYLTAIGRILLDRGAYQDAVAQLQAAARRSREPAIQTELAWALWYVGRESGAVDVLDSALRQSGERPEILRARGEILSDLARPERALSDLGKVKPHEQPSTQAAYALALALSGDVRKAVEAVPRLDVDSDAATLLRAARVMKEAGRDSEASRLACRARESRGRRPLPPQLTEAADRLIGTTA
ncbi:tetratricopeptide repeat protein [Nonomuraea sp. PA05]|uniref:tetratricopeptide repeat protein n=1 Tax=Nonomuraea sp. PA05 TaxID=2604466 RepID=UPI0011D6DAFF|nr:tetratricopeptide repeat protein [Nonomuraea sp. PA05]TYB57220.1 tetratricopeptide repeat protein [Nonomuraea sp. PA05]